MAALPNMLEHDRKRAGWSVEQAARRLGVSFREYREIEAGERAPAWETWDRICKLFGWGQTLAETRTRPPVDATNAAVNLPLTTATTSRCR